MSRISPDELTRAIELAQLDEVKRLIAEGANPYQPNSSGQSALEVWQDSQKKGNPYAVEMGQAILGRIPTTPYEQAALYEAQDRQMANLAKALGVAEHCRKELINPQSAYLPPQTLESSKACWDLILKAYETLYSRHPTVDKVGFSHHFLLGLKEGSQRIFRAHDSDFANLRESSGSPVRVHQEVVWDFARRLGKKLPEEWVYLSSQGTLRATATEGPDFHVTSRGLIKTTASGVVNATGKIENGIGDKLGEMASKAMQTFASWRQQRQPKKTEPGNIKGPHP